jgi:hypothetical protein
VNAYLPTAVSFLYDQNGNLRTNGTRIFEYDDENQLTRVTEPGAWKSEFTYDGKMKMRISIVHARTRHPGDVVRQTEQTLENIERLIAPDNFARHGMPGAGATLRDIAKLRVYVKNAAHGVAAPESMLPSKTVFSSFNFSRSMRLAALLLIQPRSICVVGR